MIYLYSTSLWGSYEAFKRFNLMSYGHLGQIKESLRGTIINVSCEFFPASIDSSGEIHNQAAPTQQAQAGSTPVEDEPQNEVLPSQAAGPKGSTDTADSDDLISFPTIKLLKVEYE